MLDGKKFIFIGNSFTHYGGTVIAKTCDILHQPLRTNDDGYFYNLCKLNGAETAVTCWCYGGHRLKDIFGDVCEVSHKSCLGQNHMSYLTTTM